jgi:hypothetical protein
MTPIDIAHQLLKHCERAATYLQSGSLLISSAFNSQNIGNGAACKDITRTKYTMPSGIGALN